MCHDEIDLEVHEVPREVGKALISTLRPPVFDENGLAFDIAQVTQSRPQRLNLPRVTGRGGRPQKAQPGDLPRVLRLACERRGKEAAAVTMKVRRFIIR
jgi:hypothetical protein